MKAPYIIYLHGYDFSKKPVNTWSEHPAKGMRGHEVINEEYIRKDALLEWLKECKENPVITDLQKGNIQEIIDKIKSL